MEKIVQSSLEIEHEGVTWVAEWCSFIIRDGSETGDRWLNVSRREPDGTLTDIDDIESADEGDTAKVIVRLLAAKRVQEIQAEYGIPSADTDELAVSELILARVWAGEWMGQLRNSYYFFIDTLGEILNKDFLEAAKIVRTLNRQGKAGLNGFIIVPWKEEDDAFKSWEKATGHKKLDVSDGAGWSCGYCGNRADEYGPSASEVPCANKNTEEEA
jgi:hypothetical protein